MYILDLHFAKNNWGKAFMQIRQTRLSERVRLKSNGSFSLFSIFLNRWICFGRWTISTLNSTSSWIQPHKTWSWETKDWCWRTERLRWRSRGNASDMLVNECIRPWITCFKWSIPWWQAHRDRRRAADSGGGAPERHAEAEAGFCWTDPVQWSRSWSCSGSHMLQGELSVTQVGFCNTFLHILNLHSVLCYSRLSTWN